MFSRLLNVRRHPVPGTALALEQLEPRRLMSCVVAVRGDTLFVMGENDADAVVITDDGAGNVAAVCDGMTAAGRGIRNVLVFTLGGNDAVTYNITGDLRTERNILVDLGAGNDSFTFDLAGDVKGPAGSIQTAGRHEYEDDDDEHDDDEGGDGKDGGAALRLAVIGDRGDDRINADMTGTDIEAGASVALLFNTGAGDDSSDLMFAGMQDGNLWVDVRGGAGNDNLKVGLFLVFISTGNTRAEVRGEDGNDTLHLQIVPPQPSAGVRGLIDGGAGFDVCTHTANVEVRNCEV
jgi:hypothetical protein